MCILKAEVPSLIKLLYAKGYIVGLTQLIITTMNLLSYMEYIPASLLELYVK